MQLGSLPLIVLLAACGPATPSSEPAGPTRTVATFDGRSVEVPEFPQRVLPTNAGVIDFLAALLPPERIVALPGNALPYTAVATEVGQWAKLPRLEKLSGEGALVLQPDLVVTHNWQDPDTMAVLRKSGVAVVAVPDLADWSSLAQTIEVLGRVLDRESQSSALLAELGRRRAALAESSTRGELSAMTFSNFGAGSWTAGSGTSAHVLIGLTGMRHATADAGLSGHTQIDLERLLTLNPDVLIVATDDGDSEWSAAERYLESEPAARELRAVQRGSVVRLRPALYGTTSHHVLDAAEAVAAQVDAIYGAAGARQSGSSGDEHSGGENQ